MSYLIGKFVLVDSGESYRTGEIVTTLDDHYFMVRFDNMMEKVPAKSTTLVCLHEMSATYGRIQVVAFFRYSCGPTRLHQLVGSADQARSRQARQAVEGDTLAGLIIHSQQTQRRNRSWIYHQKYSTPCAVNVRQ